MKPVTRLVLALCCSTALTTALSPSATAHEDHEHDTLSQRKHVHGAVTVNIALEGPTLSVELEAPADNVVGFEKSPRTEAERKAIADANAWLASGRDITWVPGNAGCRLLSVDFVPPKFGSGHADYRARIAYRCANPSALDWVELRALNRLRELEQVEVNLLTATVQRQTELPAGTVRISLK